jgi:hypothetical protein
MSFVGIAIRQRRHILHAAIRNRPTTCVLPCAYQKLHSDRAGERRRVRSEAERRQHVKACVIPRLTRDEVRRADGMKCPLDVERRHREETVALP